MSSITIKQPAEGYRFSEDSLALANFVSIAAKESLLDLCTGVGIVPLRLWERSSFRLAVGVELQEDLANLAAHNVSHNGLRKRIKILRKDVRRLAPADFQKVDPSNPFRGFEVISVNPPYYPVGEGRLNPDRQRAIARHEVHLKLPELVKVCDLWLKPHGRLYLIHAGERELELVSHLTRNGFGVKQRAHFHASVMLEAIRLNPERRSQPPTAMMGN